MNGIAKLDHAEERINSDFAGAQELQEYRSCRNAGVTGVQELQECRRYRSTGVQEYRSAGVRELQKTLLTGGPGLLPVIEFPATRLCTRERPVFAHSATPELLQLLNS
jgi:hypothetical protein